MRIVDVHAHLFPPGVASGPGLPRLEVDDATGGRLMIDDRVFRTVSAALWDVDARLTELDAQDVQLQVVSPVPVTLEVDGIPDGAAFHRSLNEGIAAAVARAPDRLVGLGAVPTEDVGAAIDELEHAVTGLGLAGVEIGARTGGRELDDPALLPLFRAADALGALVFVHPLGGGAGAVRRTGQPYDFGLGMLTDTALAASALVFGGVLDACPGLRVLLAHGCGTFAWAHPRLSAGSALGGDHSSGDHDALVRRLWVDTLVFDPAQLGLLAHRFGADHVMVGSDHPFIPGQLEDARDLVGAAVRRGDLTDEEGAAVLAHNALALLGVGPAIASVRR
ncbi:amidohydrolase family protein [Nocardioides sp.]|uniref:amidohydrolase family protein n=1 Tax=Nocardioides sp. TaxID=35761 RepID=UPI00261FF172|nr:amidohydrolase family protein [Nocardioides sp.]